MAMKSFVGDRAAELSPSPGLGSLVNARLGQKILDFARQIKQFILPSL